MGWRVSTWLILLRLFQLLAAFIPGAMNGWLLYYTHDKRLGASDLMLVLEVLVALIFVYSSLSLLVLHTRQRSKSASWMACSVCFDVVFCMIDVTVVSLLAYSGLPTNCYGLTTITSTKPDRGGYTTIGFSNEMDGHKGQLDKFCSLERGFYFCSVLIILAYIATIILSILRICETNFTRNSQVQQLIDEREELLRLELKVQEQEAHSQTPSTALGTNPRNAAPRSEATLASPATGRPVDPSRSSSPSFMGANLAVIPEASVSPVSPLSTMPPETGFNLSSTDINANLAMVTDGSRYGGPQTSQLPPYSPGMRSTMSGHGDESNDIRLSEYVKGETRAQDMKDAGTFQ